MAYRSKELIESLGVFVPLCEFKFLSQDFTDHMPMHIG